MSDHVVDVIADYLEGRISPDERSAFDSHVAGCERCAKELLFARDFQDSAMQQGFMHIRPGRLVSLATQSDTAATTLEQEHLTACNDCRQELAWLERSVAEGTPPDESPVDNDEAAAERKPSKPTRSLFRAWAWGFAAAAAALFIFLALPDRDDATLTRYAQITPVPVNITRQPVRPGSFEEQRILGLEAYRDGNYADARTHLTNAADLKPGDAEVLLYLGSASLLQHEFEEAIEHLSSCAGSARSAGLRHEALWQLANAYLADNQADDARTTLQQVIETTGPRSGDARRILEELTE